VGSCQITLEWDPMVAEISIIDDSDFSSLYYYINNTAGNVHLLCSTVNPLTGNFDICHIIFDAIGTEGSTCVLDISYSEVFTDDPLPVLIPHDVVDGVLMIVP